MVVVVVVVTRAIDEVCCGPLGRAAGGRRDGTAPPGWAATFGVDNVGVTGVGSMSSKGGSGGGGRQRKGRERQTVSAVLPWLVKLAHDVMDGRDGGR